MDFEQKYKEALERAKNLYNGRKAMHYTDEVSDLESIFPELAESEDERTRKEIINFLRSPFVNENITDEKVAPWLAWLEKQKELFSPQQLQEHLDMQWEHIKQDMFDATINYDDYGHLIVPVDECDLSYGEKVKVLVMKVYDDEEKQKEQKPWKVGANAYFTPEQKPAESISQLTVQGKGVYKICPRCKERMVRDDSMVYTSMPPQYRYECPKCGEMEFDTAMYDNPEMEEKKPNFSEKDSTDFEIEVHEIIAQARNDSRLDDADVLKQFEEEAAFALMLKANKLIEQKPEWSEEDEKMLNLTKTQLRILQSHLSHAHSESMSDMEYSSQSLQIEKCVSWLDIHFKSLRPQPMNIIKIDELEDFIDTELHKDEFIRRWPQYAFNVPEHKEGDEYSVGVAVGVGRIINKLRNFIVNKKA